jgi:hypothetical protein
MGMHLTPAVSRVTVCQAGCSLSVSNRSGSRPIGFCSSTSCLVLACCSTMVAGIALSARAHCTNHVAAVTIIPEGQWCSQSGRSGVWSRMCCMSMHWTPAVSRVTGCPVGAHSVKVGLMLPTLTDS